MSLDSLPNIDPERWHPIDIAAPAVNPSGLGSERIERGAEAVSRHVNQKTH
ncbi:MAG: hypothetical protein UMU75_01265 [Halomonas sp.]|nr:hypothetical protein [Halomonas sp.]